MSTVYDFTASTLEGSDKPLSDFSGQVLLVVNTASQCGFTPQYEGLEALYRKYHARGFAVLGFPCNQFGGQEPGDSTEIARFCSLTYHVTFPMFGKIEVNGSGAPPALPFSQGRSQGCAGNRGDQVEFHQIPRRSRGKGGGALRAVRGAGCPRKGHRKTALGRAWLSRRPAGQRPWAASQDTPFFETINIAGKILARLTRR